MSDQFKEEPKKQGKQCCANCDLFTRQSDHNGRCEFWKSMDVMPVWMEGEKIPSHSVTPNDGKDCEAFVPKDDGCSDTRQTWLLNNLTSLN
jgi:hypothetical protein